MNQTQRRIRKMLRRLDKIPAYQLRNLSFFLSLLLTGICSYWIWIEANSGTTNYMNVIGMVVFIIFGWAVVGLANGILDITLLQNEVQFLLQSVRARMDRSLKK